MEETAAELWDRVMDVNAKGVFLGIKAAIPALRANGGGSVINISSIYGLIGSETSTAYHSSKGAVRLLTKSGGHSVRQRGDTGELGASGVCGHRYDGAVSRRAGGQGGAG